MRPYNRTSVQMTTHPAGPGRMRRVLRASISGPPDRRHAGDGDTVLHAFAAEVTGAAYPIAPESWAQDVLDVVFNGILGDAAQAAAGCRVPSAMPTSAASEGPPPR
jgi:hypothetical protein